MAKQKFTKQHSHIPWRLFIIILGGGLLFLGASFFTLRYRQSIALEQNGDALIKAGKPEEAILDYKKAYSLFPFRQDPLQDLAGARLIYESDLAYGKIFQIGGETQVIPPLTETTGQPLKPGEFFAPILMYHHIRINPRPEDPVWAALNVSPQQLENQITYLLSHHYTPITMDELYSGLTGGKLPDKPIVLTFDDGYQSLYDNVFPLLKKYHVHIVAFVITDVSGASAYLTWDEIKEMDASGLVEFAAHTRHHPNLPDLSQAAMVDEVRGSKIDLESHLHKPIRWFAYPFGSYSDAIIQELRDAGFIGATSTIYGSIQSLAKLYLLPRIMADGRFSVDEIGRRITR